MPEDSEPAMHHRILIEAVGETEPRLPMQLFGSLQVSARSVQTHNPNTAFEVRNRGNLSGNGRRTGLVDIAQLIALRDVTRLIAVPQTIVKRQVTRDSCVIPDEKRRIAVTEFHQWSVAAGHGGLAEQQFRDCISCGSRGRIRNRPAGKRSGGVDGQQLRIPQLIAVDSQVCTEFYGVNALDPRNSGGILPDGVWVSLQGFEITDRPDLTGSRCDLGGKGRRVARR